MSTTDLILRLVVALLVGGVFGFNRDLHRKLAGLRTHALVTLGATLGTLCGFGYWLLVGVSTVLIMGVLTFGVTLEQFAERIFKRDKQEPRERRLEPTHMRVNFAKVIG